MKSIINKIKIGSLLAIGAMSFLACNKGVEDIENLPAPSTGLTIGETLAASPTDSLFYKLIVKAGLLPSLNNRAVSYTIFVPDNNAMIASGLSNAAVNGIPAATATAIVNYNIYPQLYPSASFPTAFPNAPISTLLGLDPTNPLVRMNSFPSKRGAQNYVNFVPIGQTDIAAANGIIHKPLGLIAPPSRVLKDTLNRVATLTYFKAAVAKGDSGQSGLNRFDSLLNYPVTNMTVLAPDDAAFQTLIFGLVYAKVLALTGDVPTATANANGAVALGPGIFTNPAFAADLSAATVRGILAYHILATNAGAGFQPNIRVFSVNFSSTPSFVTTLVNSSVSVHPGILVTPTFTGPVVTSLKFTGLGTFPPGGAPYSGAAATATARDRLAVNGVFYIIDKVLLPQ